jgi:hypothetical protein
MPVLALRRGHLFALLVAAMVIPSAGRPKDEVEALLKEARSAWANIRRKSVDQNIQRKSEMKCLEKVLPYEMPDEATSYVFRNGSEFSSYSFQKPMTREGTEPVAAAVNSEYAFKLRQLNGVWVPLEVSRDVTQRPGLEFSIEQFKKPSFGNDAFQHVFRSVHSCQGLDFHGTCIEDWVQQDSLMVLSNPKMDVHPDYGKICRMDLTWSGSSIEPGFITFLCDHEWRILEYTFSEYTFGRDAGPFTESHSNGFNFDDKITPLRSISYCRTGRDQVHRSIVTITPLSDEELSEARKRCFLSAFGLPEPVDHQPFWKWVFGVAVAFPVGWFALRRLSGGKSKPDQVRKR